MRGPHTPQPLLRGRSKYTTQRILADQARFLPSLRPWPAVSDYKSEIRTIYFQGVGGAGAPPFFQGVGGAGAPPFFQGVGGAGAPPFFHGVGGAGAPPFAMTTEPLPLPATAVFKPIAPTKTSIAATTVIFFDIDPPRDETFPEVLYRFRHQCQGVRRADLCLFVGTGPQLPSPAGSTEGEGQARSRLGYPRVRRAVSQQYRSTKTSARMGHSSGEIPPRRGGRTDFLNVLNRSNRT